MFLVSPGEIHKAVGPGGVLVDRLKGLLHKEISRRRVPPTTPRRSSRTSSSVQPRKVDFTPKGKGRHASVTVDPAWKARAIGKAGKNLKIARAILMRHTDIVSVSVS